MANAIKLYLDEHVDPNVAKGLRPYGVDVLTTQEAHMLGAKDEQQLEYAIDQERAIFTQDDDFLRLDAAEVSHRGIIYAPQGTPIGRLIEDLRIVVGAMLPEEIDWVQFLPL